MDLKTGEKQQLLSGSAKRYNNLYWNSSWSPDGKWIAFHGADRTTGKREFAVVSTKGSAHGFCVLMSDADDFNPRVAWHPDGDRIMIGRRSKDRMDAIYILKLSDPDYLELLSTFTQQMQAQCGTWSSDGLKIVFPSVMPGNDVFSPSNAAKTE